MKWDKRVKSKFIDVLGRTGNVSEAARAVKRSASQAYRLRRTESAFADAWTEALEAAIDRLEKEAWRRAVEGDEQYVVSHGRVVTWDGKPLKVRKRSDAVLTLLLRAHRPDKYRERQEIEHRAVIDPGAARQRLDGLLTRLTSPEPTLIIEAEIAAEAPAAGDTPDGET